MPGRCTFIAITCNSSGRYGTSETNLENWLTRCACSASIRLSGVHRSASRVTCGDEIRLALGELAELDARQPLHQHAHALVGVLSILRMRTAVPRVNRPSGAGFSSSGFFCAGKRR